MAFSSLQFRSWAAFHGPGLVSSRIDDPFQYISNISQGGPVSISSYSSRGSLSDLRPFRSTISHDACLALRVSLSCTRSVSISGSDPHRPLCYCRSFPSLSLVICQFFECSFPTYLSTPRTRVQCCKRKLLGEVGRLDRVQRVSIIPKHQVIPRIDLPPDSENTTQSNGVAPVYGATSEQITSLVGRFDYESAPKRILSSAGRWDFRGWRAFGELCFLGRLRTSIDLREVAPS